MDFKKYTGFGLTACLLSANAHSMQLTFLGGASLEWTDNVFYDDSNKSNDLLETVNLGVRAQEQESFYELQVGYDASHERYERESFNAQTFYNGTASLLLIPLPDRFSWEFSMASDTTQTQSVLPDTPDNRDQRNTYSTAPRLVLLSLPRDKVNLTGEASKITFRDADTSGSDRAGGSLDWVHDVSELVNFSVATGYEKVNFEVNEDYERSYYSIGLGRQIRNGSVFFSAGQTKLTPEISDELTGMNAQVSIKWSNDIHAFSLEVSQDLTDTSVAFSDGVSESAASDLPSDVNTGEVDLITRTRVVLGDTYRMSSTSSLAGFIFVDREKSETNADDTSRVGTTLAYQRNITPELSGDIELSYERSEEGVEKFKDTTKSVKVGVSRAFGERLSVSAWVEHEEADNESNLLTYESNLVGLSGNIQY